LQTLTDLTNILRNSSSNHALYLNTYKFFTLFIFLFFC
jgi:hypothetical protein